MSRVLLGQSYFLRFDPKLWQTMQPYPPLGTLYAAGELRRQGHAVELFDAMLAESEDEWGAALEDHRPDVAVLYEDNFNYLSKMCLLRMREAAMRMIDLARQRKLPVIVSGADASDHAAEYLAHGADFVLLGEGELTLTELLARLEGKSDTPLDGIPGLAYRKDGETLTTPGRADISDLDSLALPARDLVDIERYRSIWLKRHGYFSMNLVSTRGCPFHCNWCAKPIWGQRYHSRSPEAVATEMRLLKETYQPDHLWFADDIFGLKPGWLAQFADAVESQNARIPYKCLNRVDLLLRPGDIAALARSGAQTVWVGAESGSQKILNAMDKGTQIEQIADARQRLREAGIGVGFFLQFGYPGETRADIEKTLQMVRDCAPDDIGISVSYAMPGTRFYKNVSAQLGVKRNWQDSSDLAMLFQGTFSTAFYRKLHSVVHKEFRAHKAWAALQKSFQRGSQVGWRARLRLAARLIYNRLTLGPARMQLKRLENSQKAAVIKLAQMPPGGCRAAYPAGGAVNEAPLGTIAEAFSRTAAKYDAFAADHPHLARMRGKVYAHLARFLPPGGRILELNAGTGIDAEHLARLGYHVHATDIAPGMLARAQARVDAGRLQDYVSLQECSFTNLGAVQGAPFDAVFSNLGGLNCIPDLSPVIQQLPGLLRPGGVVTFVLMPPVCLWELGLVFSGQVRLALRRLSKTGTRAHLEGLYFPVYYFPPRQARRAFGSDYDFLALEGLSVITPTAESKSLARHHPRLYRWLSRIDHQLSTRPPWWGFGDFYILSMRYQPGKAGAS